MLMRLNSWLIVFILCVAHTMLNGQTLGGSSVYNFLSLPSHPLTGALGGKNVSSFSGEPGLINENPALLREKNDGNLSTNFTFLAPTITAFNAVGVHHLKKINTTFGLFINHLSYGSLDQTDAAGNILGTFNPFDQVVQLTASRQYGTRWHYGLSFKFINSRYGGYKSTALAADVGLNYYNEEKLMQLGFSAKNMGIQMTTYAGIQEDLPFDMTIGFTKQLEKAPIRFSFTAQHIHQFDILYNDNFFNTDNYGRTEKSGFGTKLISHVILATDILLGKKIVLTGGYNFLKRKELRIQNLSNGLTGFSYGITLKLQRLDFCYSRTNYQTSLGYSQVGFTYRFRKSE